MKPGRQTAVMHHTSKTALTGGPWGSKSYSSTKAGLEVDFEVNEDYGEQ